MPVPNTIGDLSQTAGSNSPTGSEAISNSLDNYLRTAFAFVRSFHGIASASIAASSTVSVGGADAEVVTITGSASISSLGTGYNGCVRELRFTDPCTLVHSSNLVLPGAANMSVGTGQHYTVRCIASGIWVLVAFNVTPAGSLPGTLAAWSAIATAAKQDALGYTPVNKAGDTMTGSLTTTGSLRANTIMESTNTFAILAATGVGTILLRPNGSGSTVGQGEYNSAGNFTVGGRVTANTIFESNQIYAILAATGAGAILLRPNGAGSATAQGEYNANGDFSVGRNITAPGSITVGGGRKLQKITLSTSAPGALADGELYLRY